jgi:hypothetical protein
MITPPGEGRKLRPKDHVLPAVAVLVVVGLVLTVLLVLFSLVFVVDDAFVLREFLGVLALYAGVAVAVAATCLLLGLALDRLTLRAPTALRAAAPLVVPFAGLVAVLVVGYEGVPVLLFGLVLTGYWAVFLLQEVTRRAVRRVRARPGRS